MLRDEDHGRTRFAGGEAPAARRDPSARRFAARGVTWVLRLIVAPLAAVAAAIAGLVFAALLPICGIATICEGIAKASWRLVRGSLERVPHPRARRI